MAGKKKPIPAKTQKLIFQEAESQCAFCEERDIHALEIHHMRSREAGGGGGPENLILVCSSCHSKITDGVISTADVVTKKRELIYTRPRSRDKTKASSFVRVICVNSWFVPFCALCVFAVP